MRQWFEICWQLLIFEDQVMSKVAYNKGLKQNTKVKSIREPLFLSLMAGHISGIAGGYFGITVKKHLKCM